MCVAIKKKLPNIPKSFVIIVMNSFDCDELIADHLKILANLFSVTVKSLLNN